MRILIAEDDITSRKILTAILKKWGHDPVVTKDGNAAWEVLQQPDAPGFILLDWNMPGMEGPELCRRLRENDINNPFYIILLTDRGDKDDIVEGLNAGANDYISKPYDNNELQARIGVGCRMLELQTSLLEAQNALAHLAMYDPLTSIYNRRAILERLSEEISRAEREGRGLSIGMCDLDHFKKINDTYGHQTGDDVLVAFTRCIQKNLRDYDCIGRYGGEEFLVISPGAKGDPKERLYERLRERVAATRIETKVGTISVTVSIGVTQGTSQSTVDDLLAAADSALYIAKAEGRNRIAYEVAGTQRK